jgi:phospholipid transport system substrate-binding protein
MEPKTCQTILRCTMVACCFLLGVVQHDLFAETPIQALEETLDRLQVISRDPALEEDIKTEQVRDIIVDRFDFREMSKRILGAHWEQNVEKQDEFVGVFTEFTKRTYFNKIGQIRAMKVRCLDEEIQGSTAKVITSIDLSGEEFKVKFQMHPSESVWKIYDVLLENDSFSVVRSYRTQLQWFLKALSFDELLHIIRAKNL